MVNVAMAIPMSNMVGHGSIQSFLPADMGTMEIYIFPWNKWSGLSDLVTMRLDCSLPIHDHVGGGGAGVSP